MKMQVSGSRFHVPGLLEPAFDLSETRNPKPKTPVNYIFTRNNLNKTAFSLISLIILLIISVDNSVDKLWISCGWSCG